MGVVVGEKASKLIALDSDDGGPPVPPLRELRTLRALRAVRRLMGLPISTLIPQSGTPNTQKEPTRAA
jgi:hypothetical protein